MLRKLFAVALLASMIVSCKSKSALNYNNAIAAKEKSIVPAIQAAENSARDFFNAGKFDSVSAVGERMEKLLQQTIDEIETMKAPYAKDADNFKAACLRAFKSSKAIYTNYKNVGNAKTEEERQKLLKDLQKIVDDKADAVKNMQNEQKKFASDNGFKIE